MTVEIKTADQAREYIESLGIKIVNGKAYNIYACGCVIRNDEDPQIQKYFPGLNRKNRSCPIHQPSALINKYKICECGREYWSHRVQASEKCKECFSTSADKRAYNKKYRKRAEERRILRKSYANEYLQDPNRSDCKYYLSECLMKYIDYDAVPCKRCTKYEKGYGDTDPMNMARESNEFTAPRNFY